MKKFLASALCITIAMSLAACSGKQPEQTVTETATAVTETTETTETTKVSETSATTTTVETTEATTTTAAILTKKDYVKNVKSKYKNIYGKDTKWCELYVPELTIKSAYAESVNKEIESIFAEQKKIYKKKGDIFYDSTAYITYLTKEGILSLVFIEFGQGDKNRYHVYNIDVTTGEKVDNARLAEIAGVKSIRQAAMDALQKYYNHFEDGINVKDYKIYNPKGKKLNQYEKRVEVSFDEKYLNEKMMIGLTDKGELFFISIVGVYGGISLDQQIYDSDGSELNWSDNKAYTGPKNAE